MRHTNVFKFILVFSVILFNIDLASAESQISQKEIKLEKNITTLVIKDTVLGNGRQAEKGLAVTVHYSGWLYDPNQKDGKGKKFDSSLDRNDPFVFNLGAGQVIRGWDDGVDGMKIHGKRTLIIPPDMGYGSRGAGGVIPPNATLIFDVELLGVK
ncbi:MAG TPA: FKBP-type peptidyl-prolyl cis-trans isomerase [Candidatus Methylopumilus sp.]|jgi:FKBP-type peptidyl-prolyl cis-trans isomerase FkpA